MRKSRFNEEQIIAILKEGDAGVPPEESCRRHGITRRNLYRWKAKYRGMEVIDNGSEFTSQVVDRWAYENRVELHFITPGRPLVQVQEKGRPSTHFA